METAAFFDMDDTIIEGNSGLRFIKFLYKKKALKANKSAIIPGLKLAYSYIKGDYIKAVDQADNLIAVAFKMASKKKVQELADEFAKYDIKNAKPKVMKRIDWHKKHGHKLILLSASPDEYAKSVAKILGFDYARGSKFKTLKGAYTGELIYPSMIGQDRAMVAKKIAKKFKISLKDSYSYGNCINDLNVMELTGNPYAVNPNKFLSPIARIKGFKIL